MRLGLPETVQIDASIDVQATAGQFACLTRIVLRTVRRSGWRVECRGLNASWVKLPMRYPLNIVVCFEMEGRLPLYPVELAFRASFPRAERFSLLPEVPQGLDTSGDVLPQ